MRHENKILVMRRAPMIGRPTSPKRVSVYHRAASLAWAIKTAVDAATYDAKRGIRSAYWIVVAGSPAHGGKA